MDRKRKSKEDTSAVIIRTNTVKGELRDLNLKVWDGTKGTAQFVSPPILVTDTATYRPVLRRRLAGLLLEEEHCFHKETADRYQRHGTGNAT